VRRRLRFPAPAPPAASNASSFRHPIDAASREQLVSAYRARFPAAAAAEIEEAARLASHRFTLLNQTFDFGDTIGWWRDPVSGRDWPASYAEDISYRGASRLGDIKLPWELNKHQYFVTLGKAAWLTNDRAPADEIVRQIRHWIETNPYKTGINWISALEAGTRIISWTLAYPFYREYLDQPMANRIARSLAQHCLFVEQTLSLGAFANTHLAGEAAALVAGGLFLECRHSRRWIEKGLAILEQEAERQSTPDGAHVERSVAYHRFFLDQYYLVAALLAANGRSLPPNTLAIVERMTAYLMAVLFPDGTAPAFGDADDARGIWLRADAPSDYRGLLALGSVLFGRPDFKFAAHGAAEDVLWLFGPSGLAAFDRLEARPPGPASKAFPDGGYYIMRDGWQPASPMLVFDCGPVGFGPAGHGHADALSIQLHAGNYTFLTDAGTYSYNLDYGWRDAFRMTRAHNTVAVDGQSQSIPGDRMSWARQAAASARAWTTTPWFDLVEGEHDGYERLADSVRHRRTVVFLKPDIWILVDTLTAAAAHEYELLLHARPDARVSLQPHTSNAVIASPAGQQLRIQTSSDQGVLPPFTILEASDREPAAWFSPGYAVRVPSPTLSVKATASGRCTLVTRLTLTERDCVVNAGDSALHIHVPGPEPVDLWWSSERCSLERGPARFEGRLLFQRTRNETVTSARAEQFTRLTLENLLDVTAAQPIAGLTYEAETHRLAIACDDPSLVRVVARRDISVELTRVQA